ncbi:adenylyl-sulfate reductase [Ectothiorhodospiraceae bacterium 2226]|nr:adenylyl-sulfate reductase [Ectothiorhodospiraceae bacterium 2226]
MQIFIVAMVVLVIAGTIFDVIHKRSAEYFFAAGERSRAARKRDVNKGAIAMKTLAHDVLASGEFCNPQRRVAHLLTMYGFVLFVVATAVLVFGYAEAAAPAIWPLLWYVGAAMVVVGGFWFWFKIRVNVASGGNPWYRIVRADLFILSLLATTSFAILWGIFATAGGGWLAHLFFWLFMISAVVLFGGVPWSKFAHMFFKPAAAYQKRVAEADGSNLNLPADYDLTDPAVQARFPDIPEYMGKNPPNMGPGIRREPASHY